MKQALSEALEHLPAISGVATDRHSIPADRLLILATAARLVERLLPGECSNPMHGRPFSPNAIDVPDTCSDCVAGQVWDEGIVEAVAKYLGEFAHFSEDRARGVLAVLVELLTEKVK